MKTIFSLVMLILGVALMAHGQTAPAAGAAVQAIAGAALNAALGAAAQQAPTVTSTLSSGVFWGAIATVMSSYNLILSGLQQLFGLGAKASNKTVANASSKALTGLQHLSGTPTITPATPPASAGTQA